MKYLTIALLLQVAAAAFNSSLYTNSQVLLTHQYNLFWNVNASHIQIALQVNTLGWVGFGIGEQTSGSMPGADILVGIVSEGVATITDNHALGKYTPLEDDCQDWVLLNGEQDNGWTVLEVVRKLDTGDLQDRPITGRNRIVFAWGLTTTFQYHGVNRHFNAVTFFGPTPGTIVIGAPGVVTEDFINYNFVIPTVTTYYAEVYFPLNLTVPVHVVRLEALIYPNASAYVHHFVLYGCYNTSCNEVVWGWAPGVDYFELPPVTGYLIGPGGWNVLRMQVHYNNPSLVADVIDNSGIRIYYTPNLRQYDAGVLEFGDPSVTNPNLIPQGSSLITYEYNCPSECTSTFPGPLNVFGDTLHMHQIGQMTWSTHWRNGQLLGYLNRIEFWDFAFQQTTSLNLTILPGDRFNTHCMYQENSLQTTKFSLASSDEMCLEFVYYYPKLPLGYCSYVFDKSSQRNYTLCEGNVIQLGVTNYQSNPSLLDPAGGEVRVFGSTNPSSFQCANPLNPTTSQSAPPFSNQPTSTTKNNISFSAASSLQLAFGFLLLSLYLI